MGANFPWVDCGWDFGPPPPGWTRSPARDWGQIERDLRELAALGISVVRWWILGAGTNYPVGRSIREIAEPVKNALGKPIAWRLPPGAPLPPLPEAFLRDFENLCRASANAGVRLVPSLLSFEWFDRADRFSRGRRDLVLGPRRADYRTAIDRFLDATLEPLLACSQQHRGAIFAWESINEPDWIVRGGLPHVQVAKTVEPWEMNALIFQATERIVRAGFVASVGFKHGGAKWVQPFLWDYLGRAAADHRYAHQHHHYPTRFTERVLPPAIRFPVRQVMLGEFPTGNVQASLSNWRWSDPGLSEADPACYLERRLELIRSHGYLGGWLWASEPEWIKQRRLAMGGALEPDPRVRWTVSQRDQVRRFNRGFVA